MGSLHGLGEHFARRIAFRPAGKRDVERHGDVGEAVAVLVADLVGADVDLERIGGGPSRT